MKRKIGVALAVLLVMAIMPVSSYAGVDSVSFSTQPAAETTVAEGQITEVLTCSADSNATEGVSKVYQWYSCKSDGSAMQKITGADNFTFEIPEELIGGKIYYYRCRVTAVGVNSGDRKSADSNVAKVTVTAGTKYVIFDPGEYDYGRFPEVLDPTADIKVPVDSSGRISAADMPGTPSGGEGYRFAGWYTKDGVLVEDPLNVTYEHTTRLIARYQEYQTFIFNANGGVFEYGGDTYSATCVNGNLPVSQMPEEPTREGYKFAGWYSKYPDGTEFEVVPDEYGNINFMMETSLEQNVYAKWEKLPAEKENSDDKAVVNDNSPDTGEAGNNITVYAAVMILALCGVVALNRRKA